MSIFDTTNPQAEFGAPQNMSYAPTAGPIDGFGIAYEAQMRASSMSGLEYAYEQEDEAQAKAWGSTTDGSRVPRLRDVADFQRLARHFVEGMPLEPSEAAALQAYDTAVQRANESGAKLHTAEELFTNVQRKAQNAERDLASTPTTFMGTVGELAGGAIASLDPRTDFWNFATLPVGGFGKTALGRIGTQVAGQAVIETVNQVMGVQVNRRLLGLEYGFKNAALQVGATAAGAGVLQGLGEGAVKLGRRWFGSPTVPTHAGDVPDPRLEEPPAPPQRTSVAYTDRQAFDGMIKAYEADVLQRSPWHGHASANSRTEADLAVVVRQLEDWNGPRPWEMRPYDLQSTTAIGRVLGAQREQPIDIRIGDSPIDSIARQVDPNTFRVYDDLAQQKSDVKQEIERLQGEKANAAQEAVNDISDEITKLHAKISTANKRKQKIYQRQIEALTTEREGKLAALYAQDSPEIRMAREWMMKLDYQMRDLAPLVTRAYTKARNRWAAKEEELSGVLRMVREANTRRIEADTAQNVGEEIVTAAPSPTARVLDNHPEIRDSAGPKDDAADLVGRAMAAEAKVLDASVERYRAAVQQLDVKGKELKLDGYDHTFDIDRDRISVPTEDGEGFQELTIREVLEQSKRDEYELQSVVTCSTRKGS